MPTGQKKKNLFVTVLLFPSCIVYPSLCNLAQHKVLLHNLMMGFIPVVNLRCTCMLSRTYTAGPVLHR